MSTRRVGGTLTLAAMKALGALRKADIVDHLEARPERPVDRVDFLHEARRLIAEGSSIVDVAEALNVTTAVVRQLLGPGMRNKRDSGTPETPQKGAVLPPELP